MMFEMGYQAIPAGVYGELVWHRRLTVMRTEWIQFSRKYRERYAREWSQEVNAN